MGTRARYLQKKQDSNSSNSHIELNFELCACVGTNEAFK